MYCSQCVLFNHTKINALLSHLNVQIKPKNLKGTRKCPLKAIVPLMFSFKAKIVSLSYI